MKVIQFTVENLSRVNYITFLLKDANQNCEYLLTSLWWNWHCCNTIIKFIRTRKIIELWKWIMLHCPSLFISIFGMSLNLFHYFLYGTFGVWNRGHFTMWIDLVTEVLFVLHFRSIATPFSAEVKLTLLQCNITVPT